MTNSDYVIVSDGKDPLTMPVLEYLRRTYGIPAKDVKALELSSEVGFTQTITVTLFVRQRAAGGIVPGGRRAYLVGENGPEEVLPRG